MSAFSIDSASAALAAMRQPKTITCPVCGQTAERRGRARFCSDRCRYTARNRARPSQKREKVSEQS